MAATKIGWDWKACPDVEQLEKALGPFGIHVYDDPAYEGADAFGFIFSDKELDDDELMTLAEE